MEWLEDLEENFQTLETEFGRRIQILEEDTHTKQKEAEEEDVYMGAGDDPWQCQRPWCLAKLPRGQECTVCGDRIKGMFAPREPADDHGVLTIGVNMKKTYCSAPIFTPRHHDGKTVRIDFNTHQLFVLDGEWKDESYYVMKKSIKQLAESLPNGGPFVISNIEAETVQFSGTTCRHPQMAKMVLTDDAKAKREALVAPPVTATTKRIATGKTAARAPSSPTLEPLTADPPRTTSSTLEPVTSDPPTSPPLNIEMVTVELPGSMQNVDMVNIPSYEDLVDAIAGFVGDTAFGLVWASTGETFTPADMAEAQRQRTIRLRVVDGGGLVQEMESDLHERPTGLHETGAMTSGNILMSDTSLFDRLAIEDAMRDDLRDEPSAENETENESESENDSESEEEEEEEEFDDEEDMLLDIEAGGARTVEEYLQQPGKEYLRPYKKFINPKRALEIGFDNPFVVTSAAFYDMGLSDYALERRATMHNNSVRMADLGLGSSSTFDPNFLDGIPWDIRVITQQKELMRQKRRDEKEKKRARERKKRDKERAAAERRAEREESGMKRRAAKEAERLWKQQEKDRQKDEKNQRKRALRDERDAERAARKRRVQEGETPTQRAERQRKVRDAVKHEYSSLPWARDEMPTGLLVHPRGDPVIFEEVPKLVRDALEPQITKLERSGMIDDLTGEQRYTHVSRYLPNKPQKGTYTFPGWQVQRTMPGSNGYIGLAYESKLGALLAAASYVDPRLTSNASSHSWILWLIEGGDTAAREWLESQQETITAVASLGIRSHGGRTRQESVRDVDRSLIRQGYLHGLPSGEGSSTDPLPVAPMIPGEHPEPTLSADAHARQTSMYQQITEDMREDIGAVVQQTAPGPSEEESVTTLIAAHPRRTTRDAQTLLSHGITLQQLHDHDFPADSLMDLFPATELRDVGYDLASLITMGLSKLITAFSMDELTAFGFGREEIEEANADSFMS